MHETANNVFIRIFAIGEGNVLRVLEWLFDVSSRKAARSIERVVVSIGAEPEGMK